jgi:hypothetical protein
VRKIEQYRVQEGVTPLSGSELSERFLDIDGRLHQLELLDISWQQAVAEIQNHGLERINGVIEPVLDQANYILGLIQQEFTTVQTAWSQTSQAIAQEWQDILDGWAGVQNTLDGMQTEIDGAQAAAQSYTDNKTDLAKHQIDEWTVPDDDHPYTNFENSSVHGKATIKMPADAEAWLLGSFAAMVTGASVNLVYRYMMSTADTDPVNWGLAYAVGNKDLCAVPWKESTTYTIGDRRCPTVPNGCAYEMIEGAAGYGATDLCTGGTALASRSDSGYTPAGAFADDDETTRWQLPSGATLVTDYIGYNFGSGNGVAVGKFRVYQDAGNNPATMALEYSDDGSTWTPLQNFTAEDGTGWFTYYVTVTTSVHEYWRIRCTTEYVSRWIIYEIELFELLGGTGTSAGGGFDSNSLTGGTASSIGGTGNPAYAVDGNTGSYWYSLGTALEASPWWKYDLGSGVTDTFNKVRINWGGWAVAGMTVTIAASNDDSAYTPLWTGTPTLPATWEEFVFANSTAYRYLKITFYKAGDSANAARIYEIEAMASLGGEEPVWPTTLNAEIVDYEITWKCVSTDNFTTLSLTGETAPATAWTEGTKQFTIPGTNIVAGEPVRFLTIRKVDPPANYWEQQNLGAATVTAVAATVPFSTSTIAGMYDGVKGNTDYADPSNCTFASAFSGSMIGNYAQVVFGAAKTIARITINQPITNQFTTSIKIQYHNGSAWVDLETFTAALGDTVMTLASPVSATQYRVTCNANMYQWGSGYRYWTIGELVFETYETASGSGHDGDFHLIEAKHQAVEV